MKKIFLLIFMLSSINMMGQAYYANEKALEDFIVRKVRQNPIEGARFLDNEQTIIISVVVMDPVKYPDATKRNTIADMRATANANKLVNKPQVTESDFISIIDSSDSQGQQETFVYSNIIYNSGYAPYMEKIAEFEYNNKIIYLYTAKVK